MSKDRRETGLHIGSRFQHSLTAPARGSFWSSREPTSNYDNFRDKLLAKLVASRVALQIIVLTHGKMLPG